MENFFGSKKIKIIAFFLLIFVYTSLITYKIKVPAADDLPRQIKIGEEIVNGNFDILYKNTFSYIEPDYKFYNHHWLSGVFFYFLDSAFGWNGLVVFKVIILLLSFSIVFKTALKKADFWLVVAAAIPTIIILRERSGLRPEVFSYLFIALFLYLLIDFEKNTENKRIYWLIPMQLFWVNMHVFFSVGVMLVGGFFFEKLVHNWRNIKNNKALKKISIIFVSVFLVSFLNPRGIEGVFYRYPSISIKISENQSLSEFLTYSLPLRDISLYIFRPLAALTLLSIFLFFFPSIKKEKSGQKSNETDKPVPIFFILANLATISLSFLILRGISFFAYIFLLTVPYYLSTSFIYLKQKYQLFEKFFIGLLFFVLLFILYFSNNGLLTNYTQRGIGTASMSSGGVDFFKQNNLRGPIFNDADIGSYLIYYLYPEHKVFSDNRFGDAYSKVYWDDTYLASLNNEEVWQNLLDQYDFQTIFLYQYNMGEGFRQFMYNRLNDTNWAFVYGDSFSIILVRNSEENRNVIENFKITPDNAQERLFHLINSGIEDDLISAADILNLLGRIDAARSLFLDVVSKRPNNGKIWMIMGEWELSLNRPENDLLGMMYLDKAISVGQNTAEAYSFLGLSYFKMGKYDQAKKMLEKAIKKDPKRNDAIKVLNYIKEMQK